MRITGYVTTGVVSFGLAAAGLLVLTGPPAGAAVSPGTGDEAGSSAEPAVPSSVPSAAASTTPAQKLGDGDVVGWGSNTQGQIGMGVISGPDTCENKSICATSPNAVVGLTGVKAVVSGGGESLALLSNGTVMAWGSNQWGGLGDGSTTGPQNCEGSSSDGCSGTPVAVPGLSGVKSVASGGDYNLALLSNGTVMAWGLNNEGQLGIGTTGGPDTCIEFSWACSTSPVQVTGLSGVKKIAVGNSESVALLSNGTVMVWGYDVNGIGSGTTESDVPVAVPGLAHVKQVACGDDGSGETPEVGDATCLALIKGGTVMAWGNDTGSTSTPTSGTPIAVPGLSGVTQIAPGGEFDMVLLSDHTVEAWGSDLYGDLGNGSAGGSSAVPILIPHLSGVTAIAAGTDNGEALLSKGTVKTWGQNVLGELGNGNATATDKPAKVPGLSGVTAISTTSDHTFAMG